VVLFAGDVGLNTYSRASASSSRFSASPSEPPPARGKEARVSLATTEDRICQRSLQLADRENRPGRVNRCLNFSQQREEIVQLIL
jgi:hypothetical protein